MARPRGSASRPRVRTDTVATPRKSELRETVICRVGGQFWLISLVVSGRRLSSDAALKHALRTRQPVAIYPSLRAYAEAKRGTLPLRTAIGDDNTSRDSGPLLSTMGDVDAGIIR